MTTGRIAALILAVLIVGLGLTQHRAAIPVVPVAGSVDATPAPRIPRPESPAPSSAAPAATVNIKQEGRALYEAIMALDPSAVRDRIHRDLLDPILKGRSPKVSKKLWVEEDSKAPELVDLRRRWERRLAEHVQKLKIKERLESLTRHRSNFFGGGAGGAEASVATARERLRLYLALQNLESLRRSCVRWRIPFDLTPMKAVGTQYGQLARTRVGWGDLHAITFHDPRAAQSLVVRGTGSVSTSPLSTVLYLSTSGGGDIQEVLSMGREVNRRLVYRHPDPLPVPKRSQLRRIQIEGIRSNMGEEAWLELLAGDSMETQERVGIVRGGGLGRLSFVHTLEVDLMPEGPLFIGVRLGFQPGTGPYENAFVHALAIRYERRSSP